MEKYLFTRNGIEKYKDNIAKVQNELMNLESQLRDAFENGGDGWHDNFSFEELQRQIGRISGLIQSRKVFLNNAFVVDKPQNPNQISIGCKVTIQAETEEKTWEIGGFGESDPKQNIVAYNTPLGEQLIGKKKGEEFIFNNKIMRISEISS